MEKIFKFMVFTFLENGLNLGIFTHASVSYSKLKAEFFENVSPPTADLLFRKSVRKYEGDGELYVLIMSRTCFRVYPHSVVS